MLRQWIILIATTLTLSLGHTGQAFAELAIIVNPDNPIPKLTSRQVKKIFMGKIRMFPSSNTEIMAVDQTENEPDRNIFYRKFLKMSEPSLYKYRASYLFSGKGRIPEELTGPTSVLTRVANDKAAISYVDASKINESVKVVFTIPIQP